MSKSECKISAISAVCQVILCSTMAELFYKEDRNHDFMLACESARHTSPRGAPVSLIVARAILQPAPSFYLHPREYSKIIGMRGFRLPKSPVKRELHLEILKRHDEMKTHYPSLQTHEIAKMIETQPAPRFYISVKRASDLYYALLKRRV